MFHVRTANNIHFFVPVNECLMKIYVRRTGAGDEDLKLCPGDVCNLVGGRKEHLCIIGRNSSTPRYIAKRTEHVCPHKDLYTNISSSPMHLSCWWKQAKRSLTDESVNNTDMAITIQYRSWEEISADTCYNMGELRMCYAKGKQQDTKHHLLYDFIYVKYPEWANLQRQRGSGCGGLGSWWSWGW